MENDVIICENINITTLIKATKSFKEGIKGAHSELERDGVIQRFEFTYELVWKTLKKILKFKGLDVNSPRDVFREAAKFYFIDDPLVWFEFIKKRNLTVHTYNSDCADEIFESLSKFEVELDKLIKKIIKL
jgi:nucleotidyltransferase substrate binding protein (TIGR01987 family)